MMAAKKGHRKRIMALKIFFRLKVPWPSSISASMRSTPMTLDTTMQMTMAAMGIITELVRKSKKSRNCIPRMVTLARGP